MAPAPFVVERLLGWRGTRSCAQAGQRFLAGGVTEKAGFLKAFRVGHKKRGKWHVAARAAGPFARTSRQEVWRAAALQSAFRIPGAFPKSLIWRRHPARARDRLPASSGRPASLTCAADSAALRQQGYLTPLPAREPSEGGREGSGATPGGKDRRQPSFFAERKLPRFRKFVHPQPPPDRELDHRRDGRGIQHAHQCPAEMPPVEGHAA